MGNRGSLVVEWIGLACDAAWHGLLHPTFEPVTVEQMISSAWARVDQLRRSEVGGAVPVAFAGSVIQTASEGWHACTHLELTTHSRPIAFTVSFLGMLIAASALLLGDRRGPRRAAEDAEGGRAA